MKKIFTLLSLLLWLLPSTVQAQQNLYVWKNGLYSVKNTSDVDSITFTEPSSAKYSVMLNGHEFVNLALPSGLMWATCNVGANNPGEDGDYFAWGEVEPKSKYNWDNYKWRDGSNCTKYTKNGKTTLDAEDDAATHNWGEGCRMPTQEECRELFDNCTWSWTEMYGVKGCKLTSKMNGAFVFFPASGNYFTGGGINGLFWHGSIGCYWSSSLSWQHEDNGADMCIHSSSAPYIEASSESRSDGLTVRAVIPVGEKPSYTTVNGHDFVDLGLPSGLKWAACNVGANTPDEDGDYFAWGEVEPKSIYDDDDTYKWYDGSNYTKYTKNGKTTLDAEDDAATHNWGEGCRMPTQEELQELLDNCTSAWTKMYGVNGYKFTSKTNGASVFFPASGARTYDYFDYHGSGGHCWSSTLCTQYSWETFLAYGLSFSTDLCKENGLSRFIGRPVRAVTMLDGKPNYTTANDTTVNGHEFVDLGLPSGLRWATCNVGANAPEGYGDFFAWGEVEPKKHYVRDTYKWYDGSNYTKYTKNGKTTLDAEDDAATLNWGVGCRMPTWDEFKELMSNCTRTRTTMQGVNGYKFTSKTNGAVVFFPASGSSMFGGYGWDGYYWSSSLNPDDDKYAYRLIFRIPTENSGLGSTNLGSMYRFDGGPVRAVCP